MDTTNSFEIPYVDPGDPQREFPPLNKRAMEIIDSALFEQAGAIQDLDAAIGTTEIVITAERAARETAILAEQTARQQADTALTTALAGKITGTGMTVRVDTTVGTRVLLDHPGGTLMLSGDTGWRDIRALLTSGWTADALLIRRTTHEVILRALNLDGTAATADWVVRGLPSGFFPDPILTVVPTVSADSVSRLLSLRPGGTDFSLPRGFKYGSTTLYLETRWNPRQPWPTSQPGQPGTP